MNARAGERQWGWRRFAALTGLILCEGLLLGVPFDSATPRQRLPIGWWREVFGFTGLVMPLAACLGASVFLAAGGKIRQIVIAHPRHPADRTGTFLAGQLIVFGLFVCLTAAVFRPIHAVARHPGFWVAGWLALTLLVGLLWLGALLPTRIIRAIVRDAWSAILIGCAVGVIAWGAGFVTQPWWWSMQTTTLQGATMLLRLFDPAAFSDPSRFILGSGRFAVRISAQCSGYEGIGLATVFLGAYCWLFRARLRFPWALLLLPLAAAGVWTANMLRIAGLVAIGSHLSPTVAVGGFHSYAGVLLVAGVCIGTVWAADRCPLFRKDRHMTTRRRNAAAAWLIPFLVLTAAKLIAGLFSSTGFEAFHLVALLAAAIAPIPEELAFRGYLARRLMSADFESVSMKRLSFPAVAVSSIAFAAAHGLCWPASLLAGAAYATLAKRTGRLSDAILLHAIINALLMIAALTTGSWWLLA